jgi:hypothetical protein
MTEFLAEWHMQSSELGARRTYVVNEMKRCAKDGVPFLALLLKGEPLACELAMSALESPREIFGGPKLYHLRLVAGVTAPPVDPYGRKLPDSETGSVLIAKVGNAGGDVSSATAPESVTAAYTAPNRARLVRDGKGYRTARVTREPQSFDLHEAVAILRQWGHGVRGQQYRNRGDDKRRMDTWLVEELSDKQMRDLTREEALRDRSAQQAKR